MAIETLPPPLVVPSPDWARDCRAGAAVVAWAHVDDWRPWLGQCRALLDPRETARVERRRRDIDRETDTVAYALHRLVLAACLGCRPSEVPLIRDDKGRPCLSDAALWTSLSHGRPWVAVAASARGPVGVDIEPIAQSGVMAGIAESICHETEASELRGLSEPEYGCRLLALWVRKEAYLKALGIGLARDMRGFRAPDRALLPLAEGGSISLAMLDVGSEALAALAAPDGPVRAARLRPS